MTLQQALEQFDDETIISDGGTDWAIHLYIDATREAGGDAELAREVAISDGRIVAVNSDGYQGATLLTVQS